MANKRVVTTLRMANKTAIMAAHGEQKGRDDPPHGKQNGLMAAHGEQKGRYDPVQSLLTPYQISTAPKTEYHEIHVKTDKLFRFGQFP